MQILKTDILRKLAEQYPPTLVAHQIRDIPRISFHIRLAIGSVHPVETQDLEICDIGGGIGLFSVGCAAYGVKRSVLVDDFNDPVNARTGSSVLDLHKSHGVEIFAQNVIDQGLNRISGGFDVITTFDSMEHWHHSPKRLFHDALDRLKPGGAFIVGVPNCLNARKRITVPFGSGKWSSMTEWYEPEIFRGHVREPDVRDLKYIANDLGLVNPAILGRNWLGYQSSSRLIRFATICMDLPLRVAPQLCSDIYLVGRKTQPQ